MLNNKKIVLIGNPNCGKTTLFNALTGAKQTVGNWPGVTVERKSGYFTTGEQKIEVLDLPGIYSLALTANAAIDERIALSALQDNNIDLIVNIVDACHLERHLYLTLQLLELKKPMIVALNMMDSAEKCGIQIDITALSQTLSCPVVELSAHKKRGLHELKQTINASSSCSANTNSPINLTKQNENQIVKANAHYRHINQILKKCLVAPIKPSFSVTERIDNIVLNRLFGLPIFFALMYALFFFSIKIGGSLQSFFSDYSQTIFVDDLSQLLTTLHTPAWLIAILANGLGKGINTTVTFIPVIGAFFLFLAALEDSGYMARAAFVIDRLMRILGLPGKAFIPMIVGFGCNVPAVMGARTLENKADRCLTIMMTPFMSCGARLAIFAVFTSIFFPHNGQNIVFMLYLIGIVMAILTGFMLRRTVLKGDPASLIMELPPYHLPNLKNLCIHTWHRLKAFIFRAGQLIIPICVLIVALNSINLNGTINNGDGSATSLLSFIGKCATPLFAPMGVQADNWPATVGLLTGILAKEVVIGTLNTLYSQIGNTLGVMYQHFDGKAGAFAYLLFVLLYLPCISTTAAILRELNRGWAIFSALWMTGIAYAAAVIFYQAATWLHHPLSSSLWIAGLLLMFFATIFVIRKISIDLKWKINHDGLGLSSACCSGKSNCHGCPMATSSST